MKIDQGIATLSVGGSLDHSARMEVLKSAGIQLTKLGAAALVVRYDKAALAISARQLLVSAQSALTPLVLRVPTAVVSSRDDAEVWRIYCHLQGRRGVMRAAFFDADSALRWAAEMAAIFESEAKSRQSRE